MTFHRALGILVGMFSAILMISGLFLLGVIAWYNTGDDSLSAVERESATFALVAPTWRNIGFGFLTLASGVTGLLATRHWLRGETRPAMILVGMAILSSLAGILLKPA